nr:hypothetical protein [Tanacetum cinerariifolium]
EKKGKKQKGVGKSAAGDEDVVEDFVLSSDEEESMSDDDDVTEIEDVKKKASDRFIVVLAF